MRKFLLSITMLMTAAWAMAAYYVAGNGTSGNPWCDGKSWKIDGSAMTEQDGVWTVTFQEVPVGSDYQFKVTDGKNTWIGVQKYNRECSNIYARGTDNIKFGITEIQDITISYDGSQICVNGTIGNEAPDPSQYAKVAVPSEYEGVMLQAFYWDSYKNTNKYGRTKWIDLMEDSVAIRDNFDLVWFPPSAKGGGVGYSHQQLSNQNGDWGQRSSLEKLMAALHNGDTKVLADIVINHRANKSNWCDFYEDTFGEGYGSYQLTQKHICKGDECFTTSSSTCYGAADEDRGNPDTGTNFDGARDLDHTNPFVQEWAKAYTRWMLDVMKYDGFRYDMTLGFHGQYLSMYNLNSEPFFSVSECWESLDIIQSHLEDASFNTLAFDFPMKFKLNEWKGTSYSKLVKPGLRSLGLSRFAVTFIDNHDTFNRDSYGNNEFLGTNTDLNAKWKTIIEANAYLLMMPGVPCVFYPHWVTFRDEINALIAIRKLVGIHSESEVLDETAAANSYSATIVGHNGTAILRMGSARSKEVPEGFKAAMHGSTFDIYATNATPVAYTRTENVPTKIMENGTLYILRDGVRYTIDGRMVNK